MSWLFPSCGRSFNPNALCETYSCLHGEGPWVSNSSVGNKGPHSLTSNSRGSFLLSPVRKCCLATRSHRRTQEAKGSSFYTGSFHRRGVCVSLLLDAVSGWVEGAPPRARGSNDKTMSGEDSMGRRRACVTENKVTSPLVWGRKTWQLAPPARWGVPSHIHGTEAYLTGTSPRRTLPYEGTQRMAQGMHSWKTTMSPSNDSSSMCEGITSSAGTVT